MLFHFPVEIKSCDVCVKIHSILLLSCCITVSKTFHGSLKVVSGRFSTYSDVLSDKQSAQYLQYEEEFTQIVSSGYSIHLCSTFILIAQVVSGPV